MTLEEAAEKVLVATGRINPSYYLDERLAPVEREAILAALRDCREQWRIEGATAMREMAGGAAHTEWFSGDRHRYASQLGPDIQSRIRALDPNQLKDTDHG